MNRQSQHHPSIALIGLSGAGKSTVGRALASQAGLPFFDTDALIEKLAGAGIPQIFAAHGEAHFREVEARALAEVLAQRPAIIATGGGIVLRAENRMLLREHAFVAWLDAPVDVLVARLLAHDEERPLLATANPAERLEALRAARAELYAQVAHVRIETGGRSAEQIAEEIIARSMKGI